MGEWDAFPEVPSAAPPPAATGVPAADPWAAFPEVQAAPSGDRKYHRTMAPASDVLGWLSNPDAIRPKQPAQGRVSTMAPASEVPGVKQFAEGFNEGWGDEPLGMSPESREWLSKYGVVPSSEDLASGKKPTLGQYMNEALIGAPMTAAQAATRGMSGLYRGAQSLGVAAGLPKDVVSMPEAFAGMPHPSGIAPGGVKPFRAPSIEGEALPSAAERPAVTGAGAPPAEPATSIALDRAMAGPPAANENAPTPLPPDYPHKMPPQELRGSVGAARAQDLISQSDPEAVNILRKVVRSEGWNENEIDRIGGEEKSPHETLAEMSDNLSALAKANQSMPGPARNETAQFVRERAKEAMGRIKETFDRFFGNTVNETTYRAELDQAKKNESAPFWDKFNQTRIHPTPQIDALLPKLEADGFLQAANARLFREGKPTTDGFINPEEAAKTQFPQAAQYPTARAYQLAKEAIDDQVSVAMRQGEKGKAGSFLQLKHELTNAIDNHSDPNVAGVWKDARDVWGHHKAIEDAYDQGWEVLTSNVKPHQIKEALTDMSEAERRSYLYGMRNKLEDMTGRSGKQERRVINEILGRNNQQKLATLFGEDAAAELIQAIEHEERMHTAPGRLIHGSDTSQNLAYQKLLQPKPGILDNASIGDVVHAVSKPVMSTAKKGVDFVLRRRADAGQARYEKIRADLGRLLMSQGPERQAIWRALALDEDLGNPPTVVPVAPHGSVSPAAPASPAPAVAPRPATAAPAAPSTPRRAVSPAEAEALRNAAPPPEPPPPPVIKQAEGPKDPSLFQFLLSKEIGGIKKTPEALAMFGGHNPFVPYHGYLLTENGMPIDKAMQSAERYLAENSGRTGAKPTIHDWHEALNDEYRALNGQGGRKRYPQGAERTETFDRDEADKHFEDGVFHAIESAIEGAPPAEEWPAPIRARILELARHGVDPEDAFVKAFEEYDRIIGSQEAMAGPQVRHVGEGTPQAGVHPAANQRPQAAPARGGPPLYRESENPADFKTGGKVKPTAQASSKRGR